MVLFVPLGISLEFLSKVRGLAFFLPFTFCLHHIDAAFDEKVLRSYHFLAKKIKNTISEIRRKNREKVLKNAKNQRIVKLRR